MVKISGSAIKIVSCNKLKRLLSLSQKASEVGCPSLHCGIVDHKLLGREQAPNPMTRESGTWKPRIVLGFGRDSAPRGSPMAVRVWDVGRSECRAVMVRIRV